MAFAGTALSVPMSYRCNPRRVPADNRDEEFRTASRRLRNGHLVLRMWTKRDLLKPLNWEFVSSFCKINGPIHCCMSLHVMS